MPRPKTPLLSTQRILDSALAVIDEVGIDKFSVHKVARALNVQPASIYYYFDDRDVLLTSVCLHVLRDVHTPKRRASEWGARLVQDAMAYFRALSAHPELAPALLVERKTRVGAADRIEDALRQLVAAGFSPADAVALVDSIEGVALGWISFQHAPQINIDADQYPILTAAEKRQQYDEASFRRSIGALIDGWRLRYSPTEATSGRRATG